MLFIAFKKTDMIQYFTRIVLTLQLCINLNGYCSGTPAFDIKNSYAWGPGLKAEYVVPARFFYIQTVDGNGNNITESIGQEPFKISLSDGAGQFVRAWIQTLDRQDGSYIVRYKMYSSHSDIKVSVQYNGQHIGSSPYAMNGMVYHDLCNCPVAEMDSWYKNMECQSGYRQIKQDLSLWPDKIDMEQVGKEAVSRFNNRGSHSLCHYVVKDNQIYRKTYGQHVGFKMFMDAVLLSLTRKVKLPDIEFFLNLGDWPLEKKRSNENPLPIFSWCGSEDSRDIVMPTYDVTESTLQTMGRVSLDLLSVQGNTGPKWENKSEIAFWRGRDSRQERLDLIRMGNKHPDMIDARLTNMFFFPKDEDLMPIVKHISFFDFFKSKYQLNIDGTVAAYRLPYLLAGDSVVFKQDSNYYEHFYKDLKPYKHYIPFKRDLSDLLEKIAWARENDEEAKQIAENARQYVRNNLMSGDIFCYHVKLFESFAKKLKNPPSVLPDMELVEQEIDRNAECDCHRKTQFTKDEL